MNAAPPGRLLPLLVALLAVDSLHFIFARLLLPHIQPQTSALFVLGVAALEIGAYGLVTRQLHLEAMRRHIGVFLAIGVLVALSTTINYEAVAFIDPGTATMLAQTGTLWALALGIFWLRERLSRAQLAGAVLAIIGLFVMTYQAGDFLRIGSLLVLASAFLYALHAAVAKRGSDIPFLDFFFFRVLATALFLLFFTGVRGSLHWPTANAWPFILLAATTDVVISRALYYLALRRMTLTLHTIALTLSPIATIVWAFLLFKTLPGPQQLLGGLLVLAGIAIIGLSRAAIQSSSLDRKSA